MSSHKFWKNIHKLSKSKDSVNGGDCINEWEYIAWYAPALLGHCVCNAKIKKEDYCYHNKKTDKYIAVGTGCRKNHKFKDFNQKNKKKGTGIFPATRWG